VPVRRYQLATAPLPAALRRTILPQGHALSDTRGDPQSFRLDAAGRLVTGGALLHRFGWRRRIEARLAARVQRVFPQLGPVQFAAAWWGVLGATPDQLPHLYELAPGVMAWNGCNGRGIGLAIALGRELARSAAGVPLPELAAPVETRLRRMPGPTLRGFGTGWALLRDRAADRRK
jgi:glycine/D-amino acid oxidase-like deaminating enzyme